MKKVRVYISALIAVFIAVVSIGAFDPVRFVHAEESEAIRVLRECDEYVSDREFTAELTGEIEARVFGIRYRQGVSGERTVRGGEYSERSESVSTFVKAAISKVVRGGRYYVSHGKFKRGSAVYGEPEEMSRADFDAAFGAPVLGLTKYDISDGSILSAEKIGDNEYLYRLDPQKATVASRNAVRTALGGESYPEYYSVEMTVVTDGVKPIRVECRETLRVDKFGGTDCSAVYTETFRFGGPRRHPYSARYRQPKAARLANVK